MQAQLANVTTGDWGRPKDGYEWGAAAWKRMAWAKTVLLPAAMRHGGVSVAWSDVDVVWFRDPTPLLAAHPEVKPCSISSICDRRTSLDTMHPAQWQ
jgi:Nucleotide-diphospho-sugar transferase